MHTTNYTIQGFTASVPETALAAIARSHGVHLINDLGCGMLLNLKDFGLPHEPTAREAIAAGCDIVTFSSDKLLGGPQCGLIVGRRDLIARIRKNPMKRALRLDKVRLAALAERLLPHLSAAVTGRAAARVVKCASQIGSRALPVASLPSAGIALLPTEKRKCGAVDSLAAAFRSLPIPVIGHVREGELILDLRCLENEAGVVGQLDQLGMTTSAP